MADNFTAASIAAGDVVSAKDLGASIKVQRALLQTIVSGTPTDASVAAPVPISAASLPLPAGAATTASITALAGAAGDSAPALAANAAGMLGWLRKLVDTLAAGFTLGAGTALVGKVGIDQTTPGTTNKVSLGAVTTGGATSVRIKSGVSNNLTSVKASAGQLLGGIVANRATGERFLKLYNKASAPVVANDTPVITIPIPPVSSMPIDCSVYGAVFGTGIAYAITAGVADTDATNTAADDVHGWLLYA